ncbi:MAG: phytanoyl-CoA dioxygenase family protein [Alphaproteobacteria bacterium]|nr:phytanoyl-CoA dioxygenase family protein [Alphaproteobacteria bacterium]MCY4318655.1 phytanoyl-CoA dioxygenase family protein [Alphaproteobacteria bacterium]
MGKLLTEAGIEAYARDGYIFPLVAFSVAQARRYRDRLEAYEADTGDVIHSNMRHKVHLLFRWADEIVHHPRILDAVEDLLGPDLLCWTTNFFIKEANDPAFVSWHQDSTYWGLDPHDVVTAWVALSDAPLESGPMRFLPGSHKLDQIPHIDSFAKDNLLTRGQEIEMEVDEAQAVDAPLRAGEFSLHHIRLVHGSKPNRRPDRRIGLAIRYVPTYVRQVKLNDSATLVRGEDRYGHFDLEPRPAADLDTAARAAHMTAMQRMLGAVYAGTDITEARR